MEQLTGTTGIAPDSGVSSAGVALANQRYFLIDGIRTVCALIVVLYHYQTLFLNPVVETVGLSLSSPRQMPFFRHIGWLLEYGAWAVMLFWTISGFIFAHMYTKKRSISGRNFFMRRFSRLYPLHFVTLLCVAALHVFAVQTFGKPIAGNTNDLWNFGLNLFLVSAWGFGDMHSFNSPIWSVSVEIGVYIAFFFMLKLVGVSLRSTLAMTVLSAALMLITKNLIPVCGFYFFLGSLAWVLLQRLERLPAGRRWFFVALLAAGALLPTIAHLVTGRTIPLSLMLAPLCADFLLLLALIEHRLAAPPSFLESFGDITYSTYLLHIPMQHAFTLLMMAGLVSPMVMLHPLAPYVYLFLVIVAGLYCFRRFELPAQKFLRRFL